MGRRERRQQIARTVVQVRTALDELISDAVTARQVGAALTPWELPTVVACRRVIADTVMQLPLIGFKNGTAAPTQPALLRRPNPSEPYWLTMSKMVDSITGHGRTYLKATAWDATGWPAAVVVLDAQTTAPSFDTDGNFLGASADGGWYPAGRNGVIWIPHCVPSCGHSGQSPFAACWRAMEYLAALYEMAGSFWQAGFPSVALTVPGRLQDGQADLLKAQLLTAWARRHEPAVLDNGAALSQVGSSAIEAQLTESISMANQEIARAAGVMPSLVNVAGGDSLTYSTTSAEFQKWKLVGLGPYLTRIAAGFADLTPWATEPQFDTSELTRADDAGRATYLNAALAGQPWLTVDEGRAIWERLGPMQTQPQEVPV